MSPFATYCIFIHCQPFPQNYFSLTYHNFVLQERLHFSIWVCLPQRNWLQRILDCKKSFELFMSPYRASTKSSICIHHFHLLRISGQRIAAPVALCRPVTLLAVAVATVAPFCSPAQPTLPGPPPVAAGQSFPLLPSLLWAVAVAVA